jgi:hypothetical protein
MKAMRKPVATSRLAPIRIKITLITIDLITDQKYLCWDF